MFKPMDKESNVGLFQTPESMDKGFNVGLFQTPEPIDMDSSVDFLYEVKEEWSHTLPHSLDSLDSTIRNLALTYSKGV